MALSTKTLYCQARVQVPHPLSQQAPNPDSLLMMSLDLVDSLNSNLYQVVQTEIYQSCHKLLSYIGMRISFIII